MRILLTNDDGIDAPGLMSLYQAVRHSVGDRASITVVAPDCGRSECGHSVTTGRPLEVRETRAGWFAVDGTPVDCVRAALSSLTPQVDVVFSGVNAGANLGVDLLVSGTFAAAREAWLHGVCAMAVSHYRRPDVPVSWDHVPGWMEETLTEFFAAAQLHNEPDPPLLWNVNLPAIDPQATPKRVRCPIDPRPLLRSATRDGTSLRFQSDFHGRPRESGRDVDHCFAGSLTISELVPGVSPWA